MANLKLWALILKRYWRKLYINLSLNLLALGMLCTIVLSLTLQNVVIARNLLQEENIESIVSIGTNAFPANKDFTDVVSLLENLSKELSHNFGVEVYYAVGIPLLVINNSQPIVFIYLNEFLQEKFSCNTSNEIIGSPFVNNNTISLTFTDTKTLAINIKKTVDLFQFKTFADYISPKFAQIFMYTKIFSNANIGWGIDRYILGSKSIGENITSTLGITSSDFAAILLISAPDYNTVIIKNIEKIVLSHKVVIRNILIQYQIDIEQQDNTFATFVWYDSPILYDVIYHTYNLIDDYSTEIEFLSVPNLLIIFGLIFSIRVLAIETIEKELKIISKKGLSLKSIAWTCYLIDFIIDLIALLLIELIIVLVLVSYNAIELLMYNYHFVLPFVVITVLINLTKLSKYIKRGLFSSRKENTMMQFRSSKPKSTLNKIIVIPYSIKVLSIFAIVLLFVFQLIHLFAPLMFKYPILFKHANKTYSYLSASIFILCFIILFLPSKPHSKTAKQTLTLTNLLRRLFSTNFRRIKSQRIIIVSLFIILTLFGLIQTSNKYSTHFKNNYGMTYDAYVRSEPLGPPYPYEKVSALPHDIPEIKQIFPIIYGTTYITLSEHYAISAIFGAINTSLYNNKDLGWNHFFGKEKQTFSSIFENNSVVITADLAEKLGARINDIITISFQYGNDANKTRITLSELRIGAIADYLPIYYYLDVETHYNLPIIYFDISLIFDYCNEHKSEKFISAIGIDFKDGISGIDEKEAIVKKITDYLEVENYAIFEESKHLLELSRVSSSISIIDASDPVDLFICFNIIFSLVFLIAFTFIQSKQLLSLVSVELRQLGFRGCKDSLIQKSFIAEFRKVIIGSVIVGISIATFVFLHYLSLTYYALFLISAKTLQMLIFIEIFSLIISGFVVCFIALWGVSHKAKTVIEITKKEMRLYEQINRD
ncbi:MAG: hypothetical protein ACTSUF_04580 [Candidatus Heimdallarchaeaceae archaeon]